MARHNDIGKWGEDIAAGILADKGFAICERNWRLRHHEIDIVAMRDDVLVFAEVKTRSDRSEDPFDAIDAKKIASMVRAADTYIASRGLHHNVRFDIFGISGTPDDYEVEYLPDAFEPPLKTYR